MTDAERESTLVRLRSNASELADLFAIVLSGSSYALERARQLMAEMLADTARLLEPPEDDQRD